VIALSVCQCQPISQPEVSVQVPQANTDLINLGKGINPGNSSISIQLCIAELSDEKTVARNPQLQQPNYMGALSAEVT